MEIYYPPYLFDANGNRLAQPVINSVASSVSYGQQFTLSYAGASQVKRVAWVRLPSVTHGFGSDQRINVLPHSATPGVANSVTVTTPADPRKCPPGHYMLFIFNENGTPSVAKIVRIGVPDAPDVGARVFRNSGGQLAVFYRGANGDLAYSTQETPGSGWATHISLGGFITANPVGLPNSQGVRHIFVRGSDNVLYHQWYNRSAGAWSGWHLLGAGVRSLSELAVARNTNGRLQVFFRGADDSLQYIAQTGDDPNSWGALVSLGGIITSEPSVAVNADGRLYVVVRGGGNGLYHQWQTTPGGGWSGWQALPGLAANSAPVAARGANGRLHVFSQGMDNALWYATQVQPGGDAWTSHVPLGSSLVGKPAVGVDADGRLTTFIQGADNALHYRQETGPGSGQWTNWASLGGTLTAPPAVARNADGRLQVIIQGVSNVLYHNLQTAPNGTSWTGFGRVGGHASTF
ncbi:MAG TPA: galactose oxidase-like domain-containing protein [Pyrinomonadaceae bacterium]